jgi:hypothetical protein
MVLITTIALYYLLPGVNKNILLLIPPTYESAEVTMCFDKTTLCPKSFKKEWVSY